MYICEIIRKKDLMKQENKVTFCSNESYPSSFFYNCTMGKSQKTSGNLI